MRLRRYADALSDWNNALELDDGSASTSLRLGRADCLARLGRVGTATAAAEEVAATGGVTADSLYGCARVYAVASATPGNTDADRHAARAVELIRVALTKTDRDVIQFQTNADLAPLRNRNDYADLLWHLADSPPK
jgi:hypothetical protein